jgi:hypothetical protein
MIRPMDIGRRIGSELQLIEQVHTLILLAFFPGSLINVLTINGKIVWLDRRFY